MYIYALRVKDHDLTASHTTYRGEDSLILIPMSLIISDKEVKSQRLLKHTQTQRRERLNSVVRFESLMKN